MDFSAAGTLFSEWPIDFLILGVIVGLVTIDTMRSGGNRAVTLALALPIATYLHAMLQQAALISQYAQTFSAPIAQAILFGVLLVILFIFVYNAISSYNTSGNSFRALLSGFAVAVLIVVFWSSAPVLQGIWSFGPQITALFSDAFKFWWVIAAYATLAYSRA